MWESVRKYGLEFCDLQTMLSNVSFFLRVLTLNIDSRNKKPIPVFFYILTLTVGVSYFYVYLVSMAWFVFWRCAETGDLLAALIILSLGITSEIGTVKLFFMFLYNDKIKEIVDEYLACDSQVVPGSRFSNNLLRNLKIVKKRAMIFWFVIISNGVAYVLKPICLPGRHLTEDIFIFYGLEPMYESPNYEIAFLLSSAGTAFTVYLPANITAFLIVITGYTEAQMLSLSEELNHLWEDAQNYYNSKSVSHNIHTNERNEVDDNKKVVINKYIKEHLKKIIKTHATNINLLRKIEFVFRAAIAIEFTLLIIGLIAELLGGLEKTYMEVPFALMQVGMDCLTGQRVMDASAVFERAVYDCKWENFDVTNMKIVLMMLQSSQKTLTLSAGGVTMLSFTCLMSVIRSIYSAYTTLRSTMK